VNACVSACPRYFFSVEDEVEAGATAGAEAGALSLEELAGPDLVSPLDDPAAGLESLLPLSLLAEPASPLELPLPLAAPSAPADFGLALP